MSINNRHIAEKAIVSQCDKEIDSLKTKQLGCALFYIIVFAILAVMLVDLGRITLFYVLLFIGLIWAMIYNSKLDKKIKELKRERNELLKNLWEDIDDEKEDVEYLSLINVSADDGMAILDGLIGLHKVKEEVHTLRNFISMMKKREELDLKSAQVSFHCVFSGNPGTGKTTVARIIAGIYRDIGILKSGHLVETDRSGLVAEYVGKTAVKTNNIIDKALDGVLFIDEAYTLAQGGESDYGKEAIATLLKRMEDDRERLVVILAGYENEMEIFINSNPGLRSRFNRYIHFDDYTSQELYEIYCLMAKNNQYFMSEDAKRYLKERLDEIIANKPKDFGNARYIRNLFEKTIEKQANRLATLAEISKEEVQKIEIEDITF